jgi:tRNA(Ile)-lysidine synthase
MPKYSQKSIVGKVLKTIRENHLISEGDKIMVALSGGADSVSLVKILLEIRDKYHCTILACHYDHRLRGEASDADAEFVKNFCLQEGIGLVSGAAEKSNFFKNEEEARLARYAFFKKILEEGTADKIAIAHNLNDFAETLLMRLIRGAGLRGLSSIPLSRESFIRPLLEISRPEIEVYLKEENQRYQTDQSNLDLTYTRNKIRHTLLPLLSEMNPNIVETLAKTANQLKEDYEFLGADLQASYEKVLLAESESVVMLDAKLFRLLYLPQQKMILRLAIEKVDSLVDIDSTHIKDVISVIMKNESKKYKTLPHLLRIELEAGKITISNTNKQR